MNNKLMVLLVATLAALGSDIAGAEGFFVGGSLGIGEVEFSRDRQPAGLERDDRLATLKAFGGYQVNNFFAVEGSLVGAANDEDGLEEVTFGAITAAAVGIIPVSEAFDLFGKGGFYFGESEVANTGTQDESGFLAGAGFAIKFGSRRQFGIRLEYEYYDVDKLDDYWSVTGGFQFNFR